MKRRDFLNSASGILGVAITAQIIESCSKSSVVPAPTAGFTIDLSNSANSSLKTVGGFTLTQGIYIVCTATSTYVAFVVDLYASRMHGELCCHEQTIFLPLSRRPL